MNLKKPLLSLVNIKKHFHFGTQSAEILKGISLQIFERDLIAIVGASGSGKSTLMNIIGLLDKPSSGEYFLKQQSLLEMDEEKLAELRNGYIGFVFQQFNLLPKLTVYQNVALPLNYAKNPSNNIKKRVTELLEQVNMAQYVDHKPMQLSGGQQQRIAIARALVCDPQIILADEPTGSLDRKTGHEIMQLFLTLNKQGKTIILITHDQKIAELCVRKINLADGVIAKNTLNNYETESILTTSPA